MLKAVGLLLVVFGLIAAPLASLMALWTLSELDPPFKSPQPWGWLAVGGCVAIYLGWRCLRADYLGPTVRLPDYWADHE